MMRKSPFKVILESCLGFFAMCVVLIGLNLLDTFIDNYYYEEIIQFMNDYFYIAIITSIIGFGANIIGAFKFPISLPSPFIHAFSSILNVYVCLRFMELLDKLYDIKFLADLTNSSLFVALFYIVIFGLVFIGHVVSILKDTFRIDEKCEEKFGDKKGEKEEKDSDDWEDECKNGWESFKKAIKNAAKEFEKTMKEEEKKKGKKKGKK